MAKTKKKSRLERVIKANIAIIAWFILVILAGGRAEEIGSQAGFMMLYITLLGISYILIKLILISINKFKSVKQENRLLLASILPLIFVIQPDQSIVLYGLLVISGYLNAKMKTGLIFRDK